MASKDTERPASTWSAADSVPERSWRRPSMSPADRMVQQVESIDAWIAARREREQALDVPGLTRDERMDVAREVEVLRRTHDVIKGCCARDLDEDPGPMRWGGLTAVIAHRHEWFANNLALLLGEGGVTVLVCTDNGAEALGAIVAEQPDVVLAGDRLAMMPTHTLLADARLYAPSALLTVQASDQHQADALRIAADVVYLRSHPPSHIAVDLISLPVNAATQPAAAEPATSGRRRDAFA